MPVNNKGKPKCGLQDPPSSHRRTAKGIKSWRRMKNSQQLHHLAQEKKNRPSTKSSVGEQLEVNRKVGTEQIGASVSVCFVGRAVP
jgi:hypothetical protein